jgi:hypothetical protein
LFFPNLDAIGRFEPIAVEDLPPGYRSLLAHHDHMTVALEAWHNSLVEIHVLDEWRDDASYARAGVLCRQSDGEAIQFNIMRIWLGDLPPSAQAQITENKAPLGRVLIRHNLLREVEVLTIWRITPGPVLCEQLKLDGRTQVFGRSAQILVDERPTVQVLEIVTLPEPTTAP